MSKQHLFHPFTLFCQFAHIILYCKVLPYSVMHVLVVVTQIMLASLYI